MKGEKSAKRKVTIIYRLKDCLASQSPARRTLEKKQNKIKILKRKMTQNKALGQKLK